jgi:hypothetical protein
MLWFIFSALNVVPDFISTSFDSSLFAFGVVVLFVVLTA